MIQTFKDGVSHKSVKVKFRTITKKKKNTQYLTP